MLNSSYNSLTDVWSSFTRAGGAAQRIMSLLDLEPAIEGDEGESVDTDSLKVKKRRNGKEKSIRKGKERRDSSK